MKKLFNRDFNRGDVDYIFSFNLYILSEKLDPQVDDYALDMKKYDGFVVFPYDDDSDLFGLGELCGHVILPQWCYIDKPSSKATSRYHSRKHDRQQRRNRHPRPVRSTTTV